jgi:cytochrome c-type biogenesis protein CcmH/NrfG
MSDEHSMVDAARKYMNMGLIEDAFDELVTHLDLFPQDIEAWLLTAQVAPDDVTAIEALEQILALQPGHPEALEMLESLQNELEDDDELDEDVEL